MPSMGLLVVVCSVEAIFCDDVICKEMQSFVYSNRSSFKYNKTIVTLSTTLYVVIVVDKRGLNWFLEICCFVVSY